MLKINKKIYLNKQQKFFEIISANFNEGISRHFHYVLDILGVLSGGSFLYSPIFNGFMDRPQGMKNVELYNDIIKKIMRLLERDLKETPFHRKGVY